MKDERDLLLFVFLAVESAHAYSAFLPSMFTIRTFGHEPGTARDIREGEVLATLFALALAVIIGLMTRSYIPVLMAAIVAASMVAVYEHALRTARPAGPQGKMANGVA